MEAELQLVLAAVDDVCRPETRAKFRCLFLLLVNLGPRISEALAVRAADVDLASGSITFPTLKRWRDLPDGRRVRIDASRTLPLTAPLSCELEIYIQVNGFRPADQLFPHTRRKYVLLVFRRCLERTGLSSHYRLHDLRHSAATRLADKTRDPMLIRDVLGHASIATSNIYIHTLQLREKLLAIDPVLPVPATMNASPRTPPWPRRPAP